MSVPHYAGQPSVSSSPYRPGTADSSWEQSRPSTTMGDARPDLFAHTAPGTAPSQLRLEALPSSQPPATSNGPADLYLGSNAITPRQGSFSRGQIDGGAQFATTGAMNSFDHSVSALAPTDTPRATHFGNSGSTLVGSQPTFASPTHPAAWASPVQPQTDTMAYNRYAYPNQTGAGSWAAQSGMPLSMSQSVIYDSSSSSTHTSPNRSQTYYDMSSDPFDPTGYSSHMTSHAYPMYGASTSKMGGAGAYMAAPPPPEYQPEEIDSMLNQVSSLYKTANTKKMAEFYRDKWARMWLTCNYTLKPSIQISIPRTILHESYRRACDAFGLEPLQAASFGKVLRSQFPDVAQRRLGGRGKTRFHYCGFGTSNDREAIKVKSLLEDEKAGKLQLSAGLSAEYAAEARAKARSEGHEGASSSSSSYRGHPSSDASPGEGQKTRMMQYHDSPHASSESGGIGSSSIAAADDRLIASAFATLNSTVLTPPGTSSGVAYAGAGQDPLRYSQVPSQGHSQAVPQSSSVAGSGIPTRRHTVSHSYSGLGDMSFLPGWHPANETSETGLMHPPSDVSAFGGGIMPGTSEPAQSGSLVNSPDSSLHGYQYLQDPRHVPTSMPFRRSCQDLADWPTLPDQQTSSATASSTTAYATGGPISNTASHESSRKAWREYESLCQALFQSVCTGPDPDSFEQRTTSFWNSLNAAARESLRNDATLQGMVLKADDIIFQQLLIQLDGMIGDDVSEAKVQGLKKLASMLSDRMASLVDEALPEACKAAKVQASQKMAESVKQVVEIFEAVKAFREDSLLDVTSEDPSRSLSPYAGQPSAASTLRSAQTTPLGSTLSSATGASTVSSPSLGPRSPALVGSLRSTGSGRSKTPTSLGTLPLANLRLRRRDNFIRSINEDSQPTWGRSGMHSHRDASSSFEGDFSSSTIEAMPNNMYAPLAKKASRSRVASDGSGSISLTFGSLALALPPNSMAQTSYQLAPASSTTLAPTEATSDWSTQPTKVEMQD